LTKQPHIHGQGPKARTIEKIVRAQVLLLVPVLLAIGVLCLQRRGPVGIAGMALVAVALVAVSRLLARIPRCELIGLANGILLTGVAALFIGIAVLPRLGLYRPLTVLSGSMRPTFDPGDLVIVRPEPVEQVRVGQVISYSVPVGVHQVETHRVIKVLRGGAHPIVQTQGDANNWRDPWTAELQGKTAWRLVVVVPYAGYAINALRSRTVHLVSVGIVPLFLCLIVLAQLWGVSLTPKPRGARS
jgi:signal peptidase I